MFKLKRKQQQQQQQKRATMTTQQWHQGQFWTTTTALELREIEKSRLWLLTFEHKTIWHPGVVTSGDTNETLYNLRTLTKSVWQTTLCRSPSIVLPLAVCPSRGCLPVLSVHLANSAFWCQFVCFRATTTLTVVVFSTSTIATIPFKVTQNS